MRIKTKMKKSKSNSMNLIFTTLLILSSGFVFSQKVHLEKPVKTKIQPTRINVDTSNQTHKKVKVQPFIDHRGENKSTIYLERKENANRKKAELDSRFKKNQQSK